MKPEDIVFVSGIGCAARLPYYMNTYGVHSIHGRAPAVATGVALARPDLHVWVIGGDGDMLSIGGNHLIHALRRNVNLKILMFNNQIYGLTKGQYSPTSEVGKITKSTPFGSLDHPFNPISVALGAEASFVARTHDMDRKHMMEMFRRAHEHQGAAFVEVYQNCNVFNDGAFDTILNKDARPDMLIDLKHGEPIRFGTEQRVRRRDERVRRGQDRRRSPTSVSTADRARRAPAPIRRSRSRCRASPSTPRRRRRSACSARSSGGRTKCDAAPTRRRVRASGPRRLARAAPVGSHLVGGLGPVRRCQSSVRNTMPVRGLGQKNVVFCGMRTRSIAAARVTRDRHRRAQERGRVRALLDQRGARLACRGGSATSRRGSGGTTSASTTAASVAATAGCSSASAPARTSGAGTASASPLRSTRPSPPAARIARSSASTPSGVFGPASRDVERVGQSAARRSTPAGRSTRRWMGSMHSSSSTSSTTNVMIASAPRSVGRRRGARCGS